MTSIRDVAREAGVSPTTVSLVLNGRAEELRISKRSADLVLTTAKRLGYYGNYYARMLAKRSSFTLGLAYAFDGLPARWITGFQRGCTMAADERKFSLLQIGLIDGKPISKQLRPWLYQGRVDGMVVVQSAPEEWLEDRTGNPYPIVGILPARSTLPAQVTVQEQPGIEAVLKDLAAEGHRKLLYLDAQIGKRSPSASRRDLYVKLGQAHGIKVETLIVEGDELSQEAAGDRIQACHQKIVSARLKVPRGIRAVACANDYLAVALAFYLREKGIRIPEEMVVSGFDNTVSDHHVPPLPTVSSSQEEMGRVAVQLLFEMLEERPIKRTRSRIARLPTHYLDRAPDGQP